MKTGNKCGSGNSGVAFYYTNQLQLSELYPLLAVYAAFQTA
jgi:hypothetical protein